MLGLLFTLLLIETSQARSAEDVSCAGLDGRSCTYYNACSWMDGQCGHNHCAKHNDTNCDDQSHCHWTVNCGGNCVQNCNGATDCFFSEKCKFDTFCKMTSARNRQGCDLRTHHTDRPTASSTSPTDRPTASSTSPTDRPTASSTSPTDSPTTNPTASSTSPTTNPTASSTSPTDRPTTSPTTNPTDSPTTNRPTDDPPTNPTDDPTTSPTSAPPVSNDTDGGVLRSEDKSTDDQSAQNGTIPGMVDEEYILMTILSSIGGILCVIAAMLLYLRRFTNTKRGTVPAVLPIWPDSVEWPRSGHSTESGQVKRRSKTYPRSRSDSNPESVPPIPIPIPRRPRIFSGISLGSISSGGESYGETVDVLLC